MIIESPTDHNLQTRLKGTLLGVVGSFVLFAAYLAIPPIGIFSGVFAPFPVAYNRLLHGRTASFTVLIGTTTAITALFGFFAGSLYIAVCGVIGLLMPELLLRGSTGSRSIFLTSFVNVLLLFFAFYFYSSVSGVDLKGVITTELSDSMKQAVSIYEKTGVKGEELDLLKRTMTTGVELFSKLYPALITVFFVSVAAFNLALIKKSALRFNITLSIGEFTSFKNHELLVWLLIAVGFVMLLPLSIITTPALNILVLLSMLYFIQGMAVLTTLVSKNSISAFVRIIFYAMLVIQPYLMALVAGIGLFDLWADFRTPKKQENL